MPAAAPSPASGLTTRAIAKIVLTVIACVLALYVIYLLRRPLTWIFIAGFIAIALSGPVNLLARSMRATFVCRSENGGWKIASSQYTGVRPPQTQPKPQ